MKKLRVNQVVSRYNPFLSETPNWALKEIYVWAREKTNNPLEEQLKTNIELLIRNLGDNSLKKTVAFKQENPDADDDTFTGIEYRFHAEELESILAQLESGEVLAHLEKGTVGLIYPSDNFDYARSVLREYIDYLRKPHSERTGFVLTSETWSKQ